MVAAAQTYHISEISRINEAARLVITRGSGMFPRGASESIAQASLHLSSSSQLV